MGFLDWFRRPAEQKESKTGSAVYMANPQARWSKRNLAAFSDEGYQKNVIAYQAINKTADAVANIPMIARRQNGRELTDHAMLRLLQRPNPLQSGPEFMRALVGFYRISGNAYIERVRTTRGPRELYTLRPDRMAVKPSESGMPKGYIYQVGQYKTDWDADPMTGESDIRHLKTFNPLDDWYGMSPLMAGAYAVDQHNESMQYMQALLQNGAAPSGAMEVQGETELTDDAYNRLQAEIEEKYAGSRNAGRPMLLEGGLKWVQMGLSPHDTKIIETKYSAARDISLALGVPPLLLNIPGDSTYNNYKEARLAFYEETVIPLAQYIRDEINAWLSPMFGGVTIDFDLDKIPAIAEKRMELWDMADKATDLTINERREMKGYDSIQGGDSLLVSSTLIPLSFAASEPTLGNDSEVEQGDLGPDDLKAIAYGEDK